MQVNAQKLKHDTKYRKHMHLVRLRALVLLAPIDGPAAVASARMRWWFSKGSTQATIDWIDTVNNLPVDPAATQKEPVQISGSDDLWIGGCLWFSIYGLNMFEAYSNLQGNYTFMVSIHAISSS